MLSYPPSMSIINHWREQADSLQDAAVQHRTESAEPRTQTAEQRTSKTGQRTGGVHNNTADQRTESSGHATDPRGASNNNYGNLVIYIYIYITFIRQKKCLSGNETQHCNEVLKFQKIHFLASQNLLIFPF